MKKPILLLLMLISASCAFSWNTPTIAGPSNGASTWAGTELDWYSVIGSEFYQLQVDTSSNFNSPLFMQVDETYINSSSANNDTDEFVSDLLFGQTYYWRVRAGVSGDTSAWTTISSFTTRDYVTLSGPANGSNVWTGTNFDWFAHHGVDFYEIQVDTSVNFNSPVFQNNVDAYINSNSSNNDTEEVITDMLFGETYYWRVRAMNAVDTSAWTTEMVTTNDYVTLSSPSNGSDVWTGTNFDWFAHHGVDFYEIQVDTSVNFNSPAFQNDVEAYINTSSLNNDTEEFVDDMLFGETYYWRIRAINAVDTSAWTTEMVTTRDYVTLSSPANGSDVWTGTNFDWLAHHGVDFYEIQVDTSVNFNSPAFQNDVEAYINTSSLNNDTEEFIDDMLFGETYYWRVRAINAVDTSAWTTEMVTTRDYVTLSSPANGSDVWTGTEFNWLAHHGVDFYEIQVDTSVNFNSPAFQNDVEAYINTSSLNNDTEEFVDDMLFGKTYYWRVRAINAVDTSAWTTEMVTTRDYVTLSSPTNGSDVWTGTEFNWLAHHGVDFYEIQVDTSVNFNSPAFQNDVEAYINTSSLNNDTEEFVDDMLFGETYYWRVRAINAVDTSAWTTEMVTTRDYVTLYSPADFAVNVSTTGINLNWNSHHGVDFYELEWDTTNTFNSGQLQNVLKTYINIATSNNDTQHSTGTLTANTVYFWRVRAINAIDTSAWTMRVFSTGSTPILVPQIPSLIAPANNAIQVSNPVNFDWGNTANTAYYEHQYSLDPTFSTTTSNLTSTSDYSTGGLQIDTVYYWRVRSGSNGYLSDWSPVWEFNTYACSPTSSSQDVSICESYFWNGTSYNSSGTYTATLTNSQGCDSIATLNLVILNSSSSVDTQTACESYTWIDGNTYTASNNTATFILPNAAGCDSIITLDLTINTINVSVTQSGEVLTADETGATYQWFDCGTQTNISGETNQTFTATSNGSYAVIVTKNGCTDTSTCMNVSGIGLFENDFGSGLSVYPNPTDGNLAIDLGNNYAEVSIKLMDLNGKLIETKNFGEGQEFQFEIDEPAGVYIMRIEAENKLATIRLIKK